MLARYRLLRCHRSQIRYVRFSSSKPPRPSLPTDELGLPLSPPWSVHALINSYKSPALSNAALTHLHDLAALIPPAEGTPRFEELKRELEDLLRLVEAVRVAPDETKSLEGPPDGRVWPNGRGIVLEDAGKQQGESSRAPPSGRELLEHAERSMDGFYLVDSTRMKK